MQDKIMIDISFDNVAKVMAVTNQNCLCEEIKSRLNLGNACYHSVHNLLSSHLLSKNSYLLHGAGYYLKS
jgi:hypothetical protein